MNFFTNRKFGPQALFSSLAFMLVLVLGAPMQANGAGHEGASFLSVIDDLPLMAGFVETDDGVQFESPQGRIVDVSAILASPSTAGNVGPKQVSKFYENALPQLGWKKIGPGTYEREGEVLKITIALPDEGLRLVFSIRPQTGG